jgi:hypothetical protein
MEAGLTVTKDPAPQAQRPRPSRSASRCLFIGVRRAERRSFEPGSPVALRAAHHQKSGRAAQRRENQPSGAAALPEGGRRMEKALTKLGSFTISRKAKQELSAIGDDISVSAHCHRHLSFFVSPFRAIGCSSLPAIALDPPVSIFITLSCRPGEVEIGNATSCVTHGCSNAKSVLFLLVVVIVSPDAGLLSFAPFLSLTRLH